MKLTNGTIKSMAMHSHIEIVFRVRRDEFVEHNSAEDVVRLMKLSEPVGGYGTEFSTAEVEFDLPPTAEQIAPPEVEVPADEEAIEKS